MKKTAIHAKAKETYEFEKRTTNLKREQQKRPERGSLYM
jgi:hypothetical protein